MHKASHEVSASLECPAALSFVLVRILSALLWLLDIHGALIDSVLRSWLIWLVSDRQAAMSTRASQCATLLSAFLLIAGCRQRYPPPRFWCGRTSEWRSLTERESLRFLYIGQSRTRANFVWTSDWSLIVVRNGIKLIYTFTVHPIQSHVPVSLYLNRNSLMDRSLYFVKII